MYNRFRILNTESNADTVWEEYCWLSSLADVGGKVIIM